MNGLHILNNCDLSVYILLQAHIFYTWKAGEIVASRENIYIFLLVISARL